MAFKVVASKAEFDALPEAVRANYVERDGRWVPDIEGGTVSAAEHAEARRKLAEFRDNNREMHGELEQLRPLKLKFEGVDPDEYKTLKTEVEELRNKGVKGAGDLEGLVAKAIEKATAPLRASLEAETKKRADAEETSRRAAFKDAVESHATKAGVKGSAKRHVLREAESLFEIVDGELVPKKGAKHPTDPLKELTPSEWLTELAKTDGYLFEDNEGSGANPDGGKGGGPAIKDGIKILRNPTAAEMGQNMDLLATGKAVVVRS